MKLSEHISIFIRAVKLFFSLGQKYTIYLVLNHIISALLPYVPIYYSARLIDALFAHAPIPVLVSYVVLTVGIVFVLNLLTTYIQTQGSIYWNISYRNRNWMYSQKAMQMAYESIENREVSLLCERIQMESQSGYGLFYVICLVPELLSHTTQIIMSISLTLSFFFLPAIPLWIKLIFIANICFTIFIGIYTTEKTEKVQNKFFEEGVELNILANKYFQYLNDYNNGKDIRLYGMSESLTAFGASNFNAWCKKTLQMNLKKSIIKLADTIMHYILRFGTYILLIFAAIQGNITVGSIAQYISCIMLLLTAVSGLIHCIQTLLFNNNYLKRLFSYFDIPNTMYQGSLTVEKRDDNEYYVEFRNVSFRYPNMDTYALRHVNLKFKVGEKLAVVGMNGSGKTTFIKLMCRLYDPTEGEILLNGVNIKKYDYDEYMSIFSVVFQDFRLFSFSLGQNVAASPSYEKERVIQCLKQAGFEERLATLPKGLDTYLYQDFDKEGIEISGGEAQKIALARALYKDAPFIILDEPTAALDPIAEYEIYSKFNQIAGDKTAIYISHRLASCRFCDKIAVFDNGSIVQTGSHQNLLSNTQGKYYELWHAQAQYYTN